MFGNSLLYFFLTFNLFGNTRLFPISSDHIPCELQFVTETSQFLGSLWPSKMPWRKLQTVRLCPQVQNLQNQHENFPNKLIHPTRLLNYGAYVGWIQRLLVQVLMKQCKNAASIPDSNPFTFLYILACIQAQYWHNIFYLFFYLFFY